MKSRLHALFHDAGGRGGLAFTHRRLPHMFDVESRRQMQRRVAPNVIEVSAYSEKGGSNSFFLF